MDAKPRKKHKISTLLQLLRFMRPYKGTLVAAAVALVFTAAITLSIGQGVRILIDDGLGSNQLSLTGSDQAMFQIVPKVFVAQSIRPDLLEPLVQYLNRLMIETHALPRSTKELIAAYVSKLNACAY